MSQNGGGLKYCRQHCNAVQLQTEPNGGGFWTVDSGVSLSIAEAPDWKAVSRLSLDINSCM